ncbi:hypothetical protein [Natrialba swarupiae]|uniref:Uncharacterized protein n=1 Tax=Natrialba swarupiae TaxID=2448032 RepID=A0A5D5AQ63_9EURY|nr:hypothetical protein [Natrialba swarupiae]TYT61932.1 hypothetical protein FYC77_10675 [Natrialba swarupiae]
MTDTDDEIEIEIERDEYVERAASDGHGGESEPSHEYASNDEYRGNGERTESDDRDGYDHGNGFDSPTRELEEELGRIDLETTPEGYVEGRVSALESLDETRVRLEVTLPHGEVLEFVLEKPIPWSEEFLLARIVEDVGYDATSISHIVGEGIPLVRTDAGANAEDDAPDWKTTTVHAVGDVILSSLGGRYQLEERRSPEWRLVDPLERRAHEDDGGGRDIAKGLGTLLILLAPIAAAVGAIVATTGGITISIPIIVTVLTALVLALFGFSFVAGSRR